jgi:NhaA family Na+:H+ antiporter
VGLGRFGLTEDLRHWVNEALMTIFFFVVGLEIKRELVRGELKERPKAVMPAVAAFGGMVLPAGIYLILNSDGASARGWGIPMATDIAFSLGVLALLGTRISASLKLFLLSLAIADDIGAILVIALVYSEGLESTPLLAAIGLLALVVVLRWMRLWWIPAYVLVGSLAWLAFFESGIHATLTGVALGLLCPVIPLHPLRSRRIRLLERGAQTRELPSRRFREASSEMRHSVSTAERLEQQLHPWTSYLIVPLFALANTGVSLDLSSLGRALTSSIGLGVALGLVAGKTIGVSVFSRLAHSLGFGSLPEGMSWRQLLGLSSLAGIGFTVALFIATLAFEQPELQEQAKVGILVGSLASAVLGASILRMAERRRDTHGEGSEDSEEASTEESANP